LSLALQVIECAEPAFQSSPPSGEVNATAGGVVSPLGVPELVKVSAKAVPRMVSAQAPGGGDDDLAVRDPPRWWRGAPEPVSVKAARPAL
jgi:hypothetical protein